MNYLSLTGLKLPPGIFRSNATSHHMQTTVKMMFKLFISTSVRLSTTPNRITSNPNEILITTFTETHGPKLLKTTYNHNYAFSHRSNHSTSRWCCSLPRYERCGAYAMPVPCFFILNLDSSDSDPIDPNFEIRQYYRRHA